VRVALLLAGVAAVAVYVLPGVTALGAHWPLWDVRVYRWGGQQAAAGGGALYAPGAPFRFTYPPFAALLFATVAGAPIGVLKAILTVGSLVALAVLCAQALAAAEVRRRPETVFAISAVALLTWPVAYTLHLGEVNLILAALIGTDFLRRGDGGWWQGIGTGLAAGIKLTPLIFVVYLALTGRLRAAVTAVGTFAVTVAAGFIWLPARSRTFWLGGVFYDQTPPWPWPENARRPGQPRLARLARRPRRAQVRVDNIPERAVHCASFPIMRRPTGRDGGRERPGARAACRT
jgi:alpha-1,2-mannosyltransferase